jgi:hypothetical protein
MHKRLKTAMAIAVLTNPLVWLALVLAALAFGIALYVWAAKAAYRYWTLPAGVRVRPDCPDVRTEHKTEPESAQPPYEGSHIVRQPVHAAPNRLIPQLSVARITSEPRKRQAKPLSPARLKKMSKEELLRTGKKLGLKGLSARMTRQSLLWRIGTSQEELCQS